MELQVVARLDRHGRTSLRQTNERDSEPGFRREESVLLEIDQDYSVA